MYITFPRVWQYQPAAVYSGTAVQNTWYTVLDTVNARVLGVSFNMAVANETIEMRFTLDGQVIGSNSFAATFANVYYANLATSDTGLTINLSNTISQLGRSFLIEGRSVKIEIRKTTATGANTLTCAVSYQTA